MTPVRTLIIAKEPRPGFAKTRLIPALGAPGAATLADRMLRHALAEARAANLGPVDLWVTPDAGARYWQQLVNGQQVAVYPQPPGDLGQRMAQAAEHGLADGNPVMLMGTDCPSLTRETLRTMAAALADHDACFCPVQDGGYALLGLNRAHPLLFHDMPWSTDAVASQTRQRLQSLGWRWYESACLSDVDEPDDLPALRQSHADLLGEL